MATIADSSGKEKSTAFIGERASADTPQNAVLKPGDEPRAIQARRNPCTRTGKASPAAGAVRWREAHSNKLP